MRTNKTTPITAFSAHEHKSDRGVEDVSISLALKLFLSPLKFLVRAILFMVTREAPLTDRSFTKVRIRMPRCDACKKHEMRLIESVPEVHRMKLLVHRRFRAAFDEANDVIDADGD